MDCYDDSDPCQVYNIVDENGKKAGFTTFVEEMMQRLSDAGACWSPYHELTSFVKVPDASNSQGAVTELHFNNGVTATATITTILNLPQRPLLEVVRNSDLDAKGILDFSTLDALHSVQTVIATKLYLYYPKGSVWWHQLGLFSGDYEASGDARRMLLAGRYHGTCDMYAACFVFVFRLPQPFVVVVASLFLTPGIAVLLLQMDKSSVMTTMIQILAMDFCWPCMPTI